MKVQMRPHRGAYARNSKVLCKVTTSVMFLYNYKQNSTEKERENRNALVTKVFLLLGISRALSIFKEHKNLFS